MSKRGLVSGILDIGSAASIAAKNIRASKSNVTDFATPLKTVKKKDKETGKIKEQLAVPITAKDKSVTRLNEQTEELLNPRLTRALDSEKFPEAGSVLPAPGRFFDPNKKDFKPFLKNLENDIDVDLEFGNYLLMGKGKPQDATNKTFQNLYISPRTSYKRSSNKNSVTARSNIYEGASLSVADMKKNYKDNTGTDGKEIRTNLLQPEKFKILDNSGEGRFLDHPIVTVQPMSGKRPHFYTLDMQFTGPVTMDRSLTKIKRTNKKTGEIKEEVPQPNLRPYTVGDVKLGDKIGEITVGKKKHPLYNYIEVDGTSSAPKEMKSIEKFNKGGTAMSMSKQMEMFNLGGLNDQGNTIDPVTKNPVPVGSTQQEVRDDIPAQLSEGEFVLPADVVRYHGLEKIMGIRDQAKQGLQKMESMGQMGNSDEATIPDGVPFNSNSNPLANEKRRMAVGGSTVAVPEIKMPEVEGINIQKPVTQTSIPSLYANNTTTGTQTDAAATPATTQVAIPSAPNYRVPTGAGTTSTYGKLIGSEFGQLQESETRKYVNPDTNEELYIPFVNGQPVYPIPNGYVLEKDLPEEEAKEDPTKAVKSAQTRQDSDDGGDDNVRDVRTTERPVGEDFSITGLLSAILTPTIGKVFEAFSAPPMSIPERQDMLVKEFGYDITSPSILGNEKSMSEKDYMEKFGGGPFKSVLPSLQNMGLGDLSKVDQSTIFTIGTKPGQINGQTRGMYGTDGIAYNINAKTPILLGGAARDANGNLMYSGATDAYNDLKISYQSGWAGGPISAIAYMGLDEAAQDNYRQYQSLKDNKAIEEQLRKLSTGVGGSDVFKNGYKKEYNIGGNNFGSGVGTRQNPTQGTYVGAGAGPTGVATGSWTTNSNNEKQFSLTGGGTIIAGVTGVVGDFDGDGRPDVAPDSPDISTAISPSNIQAALNPTMVDSSDPSGGGLTGTEFSPASEDDNFESGFFSGDTTKSQNTGTPVGGGEVSYVGDDPTNEGDGPQGGGCVIATHGVSTGGFTLMEKAKAELWCQKTYHGKWYGEAFRKGYRAAGIKHINAGTAPNVYQEFKDFVAYGRGIKKGWKIGFNYYLRTITFFLTGLFLK